MAVTVVVVVGIVRVRVVRHAWIMPVVPTNGTMRCQNSRSERQGADRRGRISWRRNVAAMALWNQTMIAVSDVAASSRWYQVVLGAESGHGGDEYEQLVVDGEIVMQLHHLGDPHHHARIGDPAVPLGNGVALWFEVDDFDAAVARCREAGVTVETEPHENPNARQMEIWLRDLDGYRVVLAGPSAYRPR